MISSISLGVAGPSLGSDLRVEPRNWWVGMNNPRLQILVHGPAIGKAQVTIPAAGALQGVELRGVQRVESPNYLFIDLHISPLAPSGVCKLNFELKGRKFTLDYPLLSRREGSAERSGFSSADVVYLLMPDRFAQGELSPELLPKLEKIDGLVDRKEPYARHGGNLQGMIDHLDYLDTLGVTAVWSTPLTLSAEKESSYHGYATSDYYLIDPRYGDNDLYRRYVDAAHARSIKIIMDMVPNHSGASHWWMKDLPFASWVNKAADSSYTQSNYVQAAAYEPHGSRREADLCTRGWFDRMMPDLNLRDSIVRTYMTQMAIWWIEWADLDGLRVDTYPYNDKHAIALWTKAIMAEYPKLNIVGEAWLNYPPLVAYWQSGAMNRDGYDSGLPSVMDFPLQQAIAQGLRQDSVNNWFEGMMKIYFSLAQDGVYANTDNVMIFLDNHDIDRIAHDLRGSAARQMLGITLLATLRGTPQLYYGTEQLLRGNQKQGHGGQRVDFPGGFPGDTVNLFSGHGRSKAQDSVYQHTRRLLNFRKHTPALHSGRMVQFFPAPPTNIYVYGRVNDHELVLVAINHNSSALTLNWDLYAELLNSTFSPLGRDILTDQPISWGQTLSLPPLSSAVLHFSSR